jgi:hypothetical protein
MNQRKDPLREKIFHYWESQSIRKDRKTLIRATAIEFNIPETMVEKHIGEWEAGKK